MIVTQHIHTKPRVPTQTEPNWARSEPEPSLAELRAKPARKESLTERESGRQPSEVEPHTKPRAKPAQSWSWTKPSGLATHNKAFFPLQSAISIQNKKNQCSPALDTPVRNSWLNGNQTMFAPKTLIAPPILLRVPLNQGRIQSSSKLQWNRSGRKLQNLKAYFDLEFRKLAGQMQVR